MLNYPESDEPLEWQIRKPLLYLGGLIVSMILISSGWYYVASTERQLQRNYQEVRKSLQAARDAGVLPHSLDGKDIDEITESMRKKPPPGMEQRVERAHFLRDNGFALVLLTIGLCLGLAWLVARVLPGQQ